MNPRYIITTAYGPQLQLGVLIEFTVDQIMAVQQARFAAHDLDRRLNLSSNVCYAGIPVGGRVWVFEDGDDSGIDQFLLLRDRPILLGQQNFTLPKHFDGVGMWAAEGEYFKCRNTSLFYTATAKYGDGAIQSDNLFDAFDQLIREAGA